MKKTKQPPPTSSKKGAQKEFPGYPLYAPSEDIMNREQRVDADLDNSRKNSIKPSRKPLEEIIDSEETEKDIDEAKDEFAVTGEDLEALGPEDLSMDMGEDEELKHRTRPVNFSGSDLDVPGSELDDDQEAVGSEDEENNSYSLGGDDHDDLEEDKS